MAKRSGKKKRPASDPNVAAFNAVQQMVYGRENPETVEVVAHIGPVKPTPAKNAAAVMLGRMGGKKGGPARAKKLSKAKLSAIGKKGAEARWKKKEP